MVRTRLAATAALLAAAGCGALAQTFEVWPYLQPGNAPTLSREEKVVLWQTSVSDKSYAVEFGLPGGRTRGVRAVATPLPGGSTLYAATLGSLAFDSQYFYRVRKAGRALFESRFSTRTRRSDLEFAVIGDTGIGSLGQALMASAIVRENPAFLLVAGDFVYSSGRGSEYEANLFPFFNEARTAARPGAAWMASIPVYVALGNHDMASANLGRSPDGLAAFHYLRAPLNGPTLDSAPRVTGGGEAESRFLQAAGDRFPRMANYSFDAGNAHVAMLDSNAYANPLEPALVQWLETDLGRTKARWKFVVFHHPGFHSSRAHYAYQKMRLLAPLFERLGVHVVFSGHVHNYQRSVPLRFSPLGGVRSDGTVPGTFQLDDRYDGVHRTRPRGVIYVVTGAGGAPFYDPDFTDRPERWRRDSDTWAPFTATFIADTHSFTRIRISGRRLVVAQIDPYGNEIDSFAVNQ